MALLLTGVTIDVLALQWRGARWGYIYCFSPTALGPRAHPNGERMLSPNPRRGEDVGFAPRAKARPQGVVSCAIMDGTDDTRPITSASSAWGVPVSGVKRL